MTIGEHYNGRLQPGGECLHGVEACQSEVERDVPLVVLGDDRLVLGHGGLLVLNGLNLVGFLQLRLQLLHEAGHGFCHR